MPAGVVYSFEAKEFRDFRCKNPRTVQEKLT